ncbi:hypothetical protein [Microbacterium halotolerans]|uniref:hypothetical protein n=1 Tax=Microbacterium halotolerans TaxID=246613 RepID=UPI000E6AD64E|nr:hypothetical protein [Microbacterium halotolerans]
MSIESKLAALSEESEPRRHDPLPENAVGESRGDQPKIVSVRLSAAQYASLVEGASERNLPVSTLARALILDGLEGRPGDLQQVLRDTIRPEFLKAS